MSSFPILMYHRIVSETCPVTDSEESRYAVTFEDFVSQLDHMRSQGLQGVSVRALIERLAARMSVPDSWVGITFDDGNESDYVHARPALREREFSATFFVTVNRIAAAGGLTEKQVAELAADFEVGSHGVSHRLLTTLGAEEERREVAESKSRLAELTGGPVAAFAPPGGRFSRRTVRIVRELSYDAMCTSRFGYNGDVATPFALKRIPVVAATSPNTFANVVGGERFKLLPAYLRATTFEVARKLLGEGAYSRLRSIGVRS